MQWIKLSKYLSNTFSFLWMTSSQSVYKSWRWMELQSLIGIIHNEKVKQYNLARENIQLIGMCPQLVDEGFPAILISHFINCYNNFKLYWKAHCSCRWTLQRLFIYIGICLCLFLPKTGMDMTRRHYMYLHMRAL